ncbi:adenylate/guanylate cyclase domain-containing protein [Massilia forsythiae]|uniref:Adenylate/guanylate cyclase domain-containing protein n=2 Tax=Massilia forsythiae TaxID=2728020 RepID=A0A7Z2W249_9BURK|nr:adenylate/guanylate cyclase domain-containing protein [Massilia forsythiae]
MRGLARKYGLRWALGLALTLAALLYLMGVWSSHAIARQDTIVADLRMRLERPVPDPRIVIVDIDAKSLGEVGRFPWSRNTMARLVDQLVGHYGAATVGFDIAFPEPDTSSGYAVLERLAGAELRDVPGMRRRLDALRPALDYDGQFARALAGRPVVLGYNLSPGLTRGVLPPPPFTAASLGGRELLAYEADGYEANIAPLQQAARGAGSFTVVQDADGVVRSSSLLQRIGDGYYPSLALATAAVYLKATSIAPVFEDDAMMQSEAQLESGGAKAIRIAGPGVERSIPAGYGLLTVVQYHGSGGPQGGSFRYVSASDVLAGRVAPQVLRGAIVLVGTTAPGLVDLRATPVSSAYPGVEVHANVIKSILDGRFKTRSQYAFPIEVLQVLAVGTLLALLLPALSPLAAVLAAGAAFALVAGINMAMYFVEDTVLDMVICLLLVALLFVLNLGWGYFFEFRKGRALVSRFGEYVAPELVAQMAENPHAYDMEGESRDLSVMFVDVRGFTTISEGLPPKELREYINLYLTAMSEDIRSSHQGTLDKYIGDAVMAFWGAPVAFADHASRAVATALLMQASAARLDEAFRARGWPPLKIGIGVNSGLMHVGDMGSAIRRAYTVMGDAVNLGARLEGITKVYGVGIAVGEATRLAAPEFAYRELDRVRVKGKNEPVAIFEPLGRPAELDAGLLDELRTWDAALALVRARDWDGAQRRIAALHDALADDHPRRGLYALYLQRIARWRAEPPGVDWDGVTTFETK